MSNSLGNAWLYVFCVDYCHEESSKEQNPSTSYRSAKTSCIEVDYENGE